MSRATLLLAASCALSHSLLLQGLPAPGRPRAPAPRRHVVVAADKTFFPPPDREGNELAQAARNLGLWAVILIGPEAAYRLPTYSACVDEGRAREVCADILPLVDWVTHLGAS